MTTTKTPYQEPLVKPDDKKLWNGAYLPGWASCPLDENSRIYQDLVKIGKNVPLDRLEKNTRFTAGPAVKWAAAAIFNFYIFLLAYPVVTWQCAPCHEDVSIRARGSAAVQASGLADIYNGTQRDASFVLAVAAVCLFIHMLLQWRTSRFVILPQIMQTDVTLGKFNFKKRPYGLFFVSMQVLALFNLLNVIMNARTMGRLLATKFRCRPTYAIFQELWANTNAQSSGVFADTDFLHVYAFFYALQFVGVIFALIYAVPITRKSDGDKETGDGLAMYKTFWHWKRPTHAGAVTMVLSSLARFELVYFQQDDYAHVEMHNYTLAKENKHINKEQINDALCKAIELGVTEIERGMAKCFIMGCLVNALQGNWQVTLAAMNWHVSQSESPDSSLMWAVFFSFTSFFCDLQYIFGIYKVWKKAKTVSPESLADPDEAETKRVKGLHRQLDAKALVGLFCLVFYIGIMAWTLSKVLALHLCPDHVWNVGSGCVSLRS